MKTLSLLVALLPSVSLAKFATDTRLPTKAYYNLDAVVQCGTVNKYEDTLTHSVNAFGKILKSHDINMEYSKVALEIKHYSIPNYRNFIIRNEYVDSSYIVLKFANKDSIILYSRHLIGSNFRGHMGRDNMTVFSSMMRGSTIKFAEWWFDLSKDEVRTKWNKEFFFEYSYTWFKASKTIDIGMNPKVYIQDSSARLSFSNCAVVSQQAPRDMSKLSIEDQHELVFNLFGGQTNKQKILAAFKEENARLLDLDLAISKTNNLLNVWKDYNSNVSANPNLNCLFSFIPGIDCTYEYWMK